MAVLMVMTKKYSEFITTLQLYIFLIILIRTLTSLSRISQLKMPGFSFLYSSILFSTLEVIFSKIFYIYSKNAVMEYY